MKKDLISVAWSGELLDFSRVPSGTGQQVCKRVDLAFKRFIAGDCTDKRSGKPRFKPASRYRSLVFEGQGISLQSCSIGAKFLYLKAPKIGVLKIRTHRHLPDGAMLKQVQVIKKADGWYVNLSLDDPTVPTFTPDEITPDWDNSLGMDAVLHENDFLATSDGDKVPAVKSYRRNHAR